MPINARKIPFRLSRPQKARQRKRLRLVDAVVATLDSALQKKGQTMKELERWKEEMPKEEEMGARDKYWFFDRKVRGYRKGVHSKFFFFFLSLLVRAPFSIKMRRRSI